MTAPDVLDTITVTTDAEEAYIGAVLHQPVFFAKSLIDCVTEADLADPRHRAIRRWADSLCARRIDPDPASVFAEAQRCGDIHGGQRSAALSKLLVDLYTRCPLRNAGYHYANAVLDGALRRRILQAGQRLTQAAEESALDEAMHVVSDEIQAIYALFARRKAAIEVPADGE
jgi:replicative DNA helicase